MIERSVEIDFQWPVQEPFIFCVHHNDRYPAGTPALGPDRRLLAGRDLGMDFAARDGFRMYHGDVVPGFPRHPHRGFETITIVRQGYVDHSDSLGAAGRYGQGDVQWMTAGAGVQHCEMFPLLRPDGENHLELFQIWLNLPAKNKLVPAWYKMLWSERIPRLALDGGKAQVTLIAGALDGAAALAPPPDSWAADPKAAVMILLVTLARGGRLTLPPAPGGARRSLYHFAGQGLALAGQPIKPKSALFVDAQRELALTSSQDGVEALVLQARPIGEPVAQRGPFVMNSAEEIRQAYEDFQRTQFGGWPWERDDQVHGPGFERFATYPDGTTERPT